MEKLTAMQTLVRDLQEVQDRIITSNEEPTASMYIKYIKNAAQKLLEKEREQIDHAFNTGYDCGFYETNVESDKYYNENYNQ